MPKVIHHGDCLDVMATLPAASVDAVVTDPPYGLEFMGKAWDKLGGESWRTAGGFSKPGIGARDTAWTSFGGGDTANATCATCGGRMRGSKKCECETPEWRVKGRPLDDPRPAQANRSQAWHEDWARAAFRVAKPGAYLLAFGGTRTYHRMTCAIEDAGWIIRDCLVWAYASGFPKSKALLKPAWEPIVMARKPGPLRELAIDACRIGTEGGAPAPRTGGSSVGILGDGLNGGWGTPVPGLGRWPANVLLTDPIFDGDTPGVVGGGEANSGFMARTLVRNGRSTYGADAHAGYTTMETYGDSGTYSRFFLIPKAARSEREPLLGGLPLRAFGQSGGAQAAMARGEEYQTTGASTGLNVVKRRANHHPTVKPLDLMRHLVRLVTPAGGTVLDPFLGSGTTALAAEMEGFAWLGIEREAEYVAIAEARLNGTQRGLSWAAE